MQAEREDDETKGATAPKAKKEDKEQASDDAANDEADDLTKIEWIGPKINDLLQEAWITTYAALASSDPATIKWILEAAEWNFASHDPATWPDQSKMAAEGKWDELKTRQDELDGGKA